MAKRNQLTKDNETVFEEHFCSQLDVKGKYRVRKDTDITIDKSLCIYFDDLEEFLRNTQDAELEKLKGQVGYHWKQKFVEVFRQELKGKPLFQVMKDGIEVNGFSFELIYFPPERESNTAAHSLYKKNRFTAIRQYYFGDDGQRQDKSLDIVLMVNGFAIVTIELKNQGTSGDYTEAIRQYLGRPLHLPIFVQPFVHIVCDNATAKMATVFSKPPDEKDFRDFNMELVNIAPNDREYPVYYLYHDILLPDRLLNFMEAYLYPKGQADWIFPRFHQQRATRLVVDELKQHFKETGELDQRFLIQHSTGSGKSNTIVWMAQNLRNAYVGDEKLFDSIIVLTDRLNLDDQISKDFKKAILTEGVAEYAESTADLRKALAANKKVIVTTIHKFSYLKDLADQTGKRIGLLIDEAHRSQEGNLHDSVTETFHSNEEGIEPDLPDAQEQLIDEIERKRFPNIAFIALTATPSDKTLQHFGKEVIKENGEKGYEPHDVYSMDQAIAEGYIMDVAKHIYSYDTLYELNKEIDSGKEYLPMMVRKALRQKAYEDTEIIKEKCRILLKVFKNESAHKIKGRAKAMVVTSSRLAAVKYKLFLDEEIEKQGLKYKSLVAFSGKIKHENSEYTEDGMNKPLNPKGEKTEDVFEKNDNIRFLIVANKFQTGFSEALLHTIFVDKPLRGSNAVQTLSRLNRIHPHKVDTLVVDFTGSYEQIMKAYKKYQKNVTTDKTIDPNALYELKDALLKFGVFTLSDVEDIADLGKSGDSQNMPAIAGILFRLKNDFENDLDREQRDAFRTLLSRYTNSFNYIQALFNIKDPGLRDFQLFLVYLNNKLTNSDHNSLMKEIEDVKVVNYSIPEIEITSWEEPDDDDDSTGGGGPSVTFVKPTKTVKEVVEEINLRFKTMVGDEGVEVIGNYLEVVTRNEQLLEVIRSNKDKDPEMVYQTIISERMKVALQTFVTEGIVKGNIRAEMYEKITGDNVMPYINKTAFNLMRENVKAA